VVPVIVVGGAGTGETGDYAVCVVLAVVIDQ